MPSPELEQPVQAPESEPADTKAATLKAVAEIMPEVLEHTARPGRQHPVSEAVTLAELIARWGKPTA